MIIILLLLLAFFGFSFGSSYTSGTTTYTAPLSTAEPTRVPNVVGVALPTAGLRLRNAGLMPVQRWCAVPSSGGYAVARQLPTAGSPARRGARVQLFLAPVRGQSVRHTPCNSFVGARP
jgi:hypothetical protein